MSVRYVLQGIYTIISYVIRRLPCFTSQPLLRGDSFTETRDKLGSIPSTIGSSIKPDLLPVSISSDDFKSQISLISVPTTNIDVR